MTDILVEALREILVDREHKLDQLDELIGHEGYFEAIGIKDRKARTIYVPRPAEN